MTLITRRSWLISLLVIVGCREVQLAPAACSSPPALRFAAREFGGRTFTLQLPATFQAHPTVSIDSEVGQWRAGAAEVSYDYGLYSDDLLHGKPPRDRELCEVTIGGRRARVVTGRTAEGAYVAAAHWPDLGPGMGTHGGTSLTVIAVAPDSVRRAELLTSLWTVRFRE